MNALVSGSASPPIASPIRPPSVSATVEGLRAASVDGPRRARGRPEAHRGRVAAAGAGGAYKLWQHPKGHLARKSAAGVTTRIAPMAVPVGTVVLIAVPTELRVNTGCGIDQYLMGSAKLQ